MSDSSFFFLSSYIVMNSANQADVTCDQFLWNCKKSTMKKRCFFFCWFYICFGLFSLFSKFILWTLHFRGQEYHKYFFYYFLFRFLNYKFYFKQSKVSSSSIFDISFDLNQFEFQFASFYICKAHYFLKQFSMPFELILLFVLFHHAIQNKSIILCSMMIFNMKHGAVWLTPKHWFNVNKRIYNFLFFWINIISSFINRFSKSIVFVFFLPYYWLWLITLQFYLKKKCEMKWITW